MVRLKGMHSLLCSRYRKFNLFGEEGFSTTPEAEISVFDTDFGVTFGVFTCFDIEFEEPAVSLVKVLGVRDIIFPTAWFSELPFLSGKYVRLLFRL
jgi:predicted amidohydrolase